MLNSLYELIATGAQMVGTILLLLGCLFMAGSIFSNRMGGFVKGTALLLVGCYLAGLAGIPPH